MPNKLSKGYSFLIRPFLMGLDVIIICFLSYTLLRKEDQLLLYIYIIIGWLFSALWVKFYEVYRFTTLVSILGLLVKQSILFTLVVYSYLGVVKLSVFTQKEVVFFLCISMLIIGGGKLLVYYLLKNYRLYFGGNNRQVIVFGKSIEAQGLIRFFNSEKALGYYVNGVFGANTENDIISGIHFLKNNRIDEVYCAISELNNNQTNEIISYCETYNIVLKFIPNTEQLPVTNLRTDYYDYIPLLSVPERPLHKQANVILKRIIDILLSLIVIFGILVWLVPLLYIIIRLESKGPLFFIHKRNGVNYREFWCYKFRSLRVEGSEDKLHVSEKDDRVTKIGRFLRRTSIDELPQFINVFKGDMSVVGPRPHIPRYTNAYAKKIDKYQFVYRHSVRPGITGLAQVKGFRGEIKSDEDIINRIKFDVFYIENWNILLDLKIMIDTLILLFKGQEKAY